MDSNTASQNLKIQKWVAAISVVLLIIKFVAYFTTHAVSILTDALESIVNVVAGFIGLYSLSVAAKPKDFDHPYGHGKAEFLSATIEGTLISIAGALILYKGAEQLIYPGVVNKLDLGIWLVASTAIVNYIVGYFCVHNGRKNRSAALVASGKHLQTDTYSTLGIIVGLLLLYFTGKQWIDGAVAIFFGCFIIFTGYKIVRSSIAGIMDEADEELLNRMVALLNSNRQVNWVDMHNLRVIKYGSVLHIDCHLTVPWYFNIIEAHDEIDDMGKLVRGEFGEAVELFVHSDGCQEFQCSICNKQDCPVRKHLFKERVPWTLENISTDKKHRLPG